MRVVEKINELRKLLETPRRDGKIIGLVPTMGAFHSGHLVLMQRARRDCDILVVSLYVNPLQFGPNEDLAAYPRSPAADRQAAASVGVDILFTPDNREMYPQQLLSKVIVQELSRRLCGRFRPGHFDGVATVVVKLFNIVEPHKAYFGEKDWQQLKIIERMVADLNIPVEIIGVPTVRDRDGLALSSRNKYLSEAERETALVIPAALRRAAEAVRSGERRAAPISELVREMIAKSGDIELEYFSICQPDTLVEVDKLDQDVLLAIAARVGKARLIDNLKVEVNDVSHHAEEQNTPSPGNGR